MEGITEQKPLLLLGCGKMGFAMLDGWLKAGVSPKKIHVIEPNKTIRKNLESYHIHLYENMQQAYHKGPAILLLAVKPQSLDEFKEELSALRDEQTLVISIAVGKTLDYLADCFGEKQPLIRTMPNTPAQISQGITVLCANDYVSPILRNQAETLLSAIGKTLWVEEKYMDIVSALSGSGPAWLFLLTEAMEKAAIDLGLPEELASTLARKTMEGSAALMQASPHLSPAELRQAVTSPKGTTYEAMKILRGEEGWQNIITQAMAASVKRAFEISKE